MNINEPWSQTKEKRERGKGRGEEATVGPLHPSAISQIKPSFLQSLCARILSQQKKLKEYNAFIVLDNIVTISSKGAFCGF